MGRKLEFNSGHEEAPSPLAGEGWDGGVNRNEFNRPELMKKINRCRTETFAAYSKATVDGL